MQLLHRLFIELGLFWVRGEGNEGFAFAVYVSRDVVLMHRALYSDLNRNLVKARLGI